jgi:hypothetical protein
MALWDQMSESELQDMIEKTDPNEIMLLESLMKAIHDDKREINGKFKHPFNMLLAGPSQSGKTHFVKSVLEHRQIEPYPEKVILAYTEWQPVYDILKDEGLVHSFHNDLDRAWEEVDGLTSTLIILDDMQHEVAKNQKVADMFMRGSHHRNVSCIFIVQNLYFQGMNCRDIALNAHYIVYFKNNADKLQINTLAHRRGQKDFVKEVYRRVCVQPHSYIILDNSQHSDNTIRSGMPVHTVYSED